MSAHPVFEDIFKKIFGAPGKPMPPAANTYPDSLPAIDRPDALDVTYHDNEAIEEVRDTAEEAENKGEIPRMDYSVIAEVEGDLKGNPCPFRM